jgi:GNAT superfamily N-acetyltransferase
MSLDLASLEIRPVRRADLPALVALYSDDILGSAREAATESSLEPYEAGLARVLADASTCVYVAHSDGNLIGTFQLTITPGISRQGVVRATIESVRTRSDLRGQGAGAAMMRFAIEKARRKGADLVQLTSDNRRDDAHRFYLRLGFTPSHNGFKLLLGPK